MIIDPKAIGLALALAFIVLANLKGLYLGLVMFVGAIIIGVFSFDLYRLLEVLKKSLIDPSNLELSASIAIIAFLGSFFQSSGIAGRSIDALKSLRVGLRTRLALTPFLLGLLPIPGGALFSAPFLKEELKASKGLEAEDLSFINIWFRHVNFLAYPLVYTLLLAAALSKKSVYEIILFNSPSLIIMIFIGYIFLKRRVEERLGGGVCNDRKAAFKELLTCLSPLIFIVLMNALLGLSYVPSLLLGTFLSLIIGGFKAPALKKALKEAQILKFFISISMLMVFKDIVSASGSAEALLGISEGTEASLLSLQTALIVFALGALMGSVVVVLGVAFTIFLTINISMPLISLLYIASVMGYLISPAHLCLITTKEYFKADTLKLYKKLLPPTLLMQAFSLTFYTALNMAYFP